MVKKIKGRKVSMSEIKFKLTSESKINVFGVKLFRIEATVDIAARGVKKGEKGGWLDTEHLSNGNARVSGNAWVSGNAEVYGNAKVSGNAWVSGNAKVYGNAEVSGNARVSAKLAYTKGYFVGGIDGEDKVTNITDKMGNTYWNHHFIRVGQFDHSLL